MSLPSINFLHLTVSEIQAEQTFPGARPPIRKPWVKTIPQQWGKKQGTDKLRIIHIYIQKEGPKTTIYQ